MFLGRETELKFLNDKYNSDGGQERQQQGIKTQQTDLESEKQK